MSSPDGLNDKQVLSFGSEGLQKPILLDADTKVVVRAHNFANMLFVTYISGGIGYLLFCDSTGLFFFILFCCYCMDQTRSNFFI